MRRRWLRIPASALLGLTLFSQSVSPSSWSPALPKTRRPSVDFASTGPRIALTFDDGPHSGMTEKLLALLHQEEVPATFFVVGKMAERYPQLVQIIAREGHEVSNHTYHHFRFTDVSASTALLELERTRFLIHRLTGRDTPYYRPPGGRMTPEIDAAAKRAGYHLVLWTTQTKDVMGTPSQAIQEQIIREARDGGIVLMHSGMPNTLAALPGAIAALRAQGYRFVTVSELLNPPSAS